MTRVRTVRVMACHASLSCGHNIHIGAHGFYPVAALCPACPSLSASWISSMSILSDDSALVGKTDPLPEPWTVTVDEPPAVTPLHWQAYTVAVHTERRHNDADRPDEYVLNAPSVTDAMVLAARAAAADLQCGIEALIAIDDDGLPTIHVIWARTGMPTHPADTPGLAWTDLRPETPTPPGDTNQVTTSATASRGCCEHAHDDMIRTNPHPSTKNRLTIPSPHDIDHARRILTRLADAITQIEGRQDESDKHALELVQLVGVDVQDIIDTIGGGRIDVAEELTHVSDWLTRNITGHARLIGELTHAIAAAISELTGP